MKQKHYKVWVKGSMYYYDFYATDINDLRKKVSEWGMVMYHHEIVD